MSIDLIKSGRENHHHKKLHFASGANLSCANNNSKQNKNLQNFKPECDSKYS